MPPYHIIAAVDGSAASDRAVDWAAELAQCNDAPVTVVHVVHRSTGHTQVLEGDPARMLCAAAEDLGANLVVMGCRGLSNVPGMMLGSVSHRMLHLMDHGAVLAVH